MRRFTIALATVIAILPVAAAAQSDTQTFTRDGETYTYKTDTRADGSMLITGRRAGGAAFRLRVANGRVDGYSAGRPVSFRVAADKGIQVAGQAAN